MEKRNKGLRAWASERLSAALKKVRKDTESIELHPEDKLPDSDDPFEAGEKLEAISDSWNEKESVGQESELFGDEDETSDPYRTGMHAETESNFDAFFEDETMAPYGETSQVWMEKGQRVQNDSWFVDDDDSVPSSGGIASEHPATIGFYSSSDHEGIDYDQHATKNSLGGADYDQDVTMNPYGEAGYGQKKAMNPFGDADYDQDVTMNPYGEAGYGQKKAMNPFGDADYDQDVTVNPYGRSVYERDKAMNPFREAAYDQDETINPFYDQDETINPFGRDFYDQDETINPFGRAFCDQDETINPFGRVAYDQDETINPFSDAAYDQDVTANPYAGTYNSVNRGNPYINTWDRSERRSDLPNGAYAHDMYGGQFFDDEEEVTINPYSTDWMPKLTVGFVIRSNKGEKHEEITFSGSMWIGNGLKCELELDISGDAEYCAELTYGGGNLYVRNIQSNKGEIFLNEAILQNELVPLQKGGCITMADIRITIEYIC